MTMELLRYSTNAWGQRTLEGVSWDLIGICFLIGDVFIALHALYMWLCPPEQKKTCVKI